MAAQGSQLEMGEIHGRSKQKLNNHRDSADNEGVVLALVEVICYTPKYLGGQDILDGQFGWDVPALRLNDHDRNVLAALFTRKVADE